MSKENRWDGIKRPYTKDDVTRLKGSLKIEYTLAQTGAEKLWEKFHSQNYVSALGALTGNQAMQQAKAGLDSVYLSGWQVAGDANNSLEMYPDQSLYAANSVPIIVKRINNTFTRADQIQTMEGEGDIDYFLPIVADMESGFGGVLNTHELMKHMIEAGAAGVHLEDQLSSAKKCGHMGGKVLVPTSEFIRKLTAARLAADVMGVPTVLMARTDANSAKLLTSDVDPRDHEFIASKERTAEGFFRIKGGLECAIARGLAYAPHCDLLWCETSKPDLGEAQEFADAIHEKYPNQMLAYNCSPSFNWSMHLDDLTIEKFQEKIGEMGYKFQFVTLAGFHALNTSMFELATGYSTRGMGAYSELQKREFELQETKGFKAVKHQSFVGTGYFDTVQNTVAGGESSTAALKESTEVEQFNKRAA